MPGESELYNDNQHILTCTVCACRYPATRRRLAGEVVPMHVCSDRCRAFLHARLSAAREVERLTA